MAGDRPGAWNRRGERGRTIAVIGLSAMAVGVGSCATGSLVRRRASVRLSTSMEQQRGEYEGPLPVLPDQQRGLNALDRGEALQRLGTWSAGVGAVLVVVGLIAT
jgi:hypothetical protein